MSKIAGVVPPIGTPVSRQDRVDEPGLRRLTRHLVDAGVDALLADGAMGVFAFLTDDEQSDLIAARELFRHGYIRGAFDESLGYLGIADGAIGVPTFPSWEQKCPRRCTQSLTSM
jgi:hypothetical protein